MRAFAEREFALTAVDEKGVTYRETLEGLVKRARTAARRAELEQEMRALPLPPALAYLWNAFQRLSARRPQNGMALSPIPWSEIEAFSRLVLRLAPWEVATIEEIDALLLNERMKAKA